MLLQCLSYNLSSSDRQLLLPDKPRAEMLATSDVLKRLSAKYTVMQKASCDVMLRHLESQFDCIGMSH